MLGECQMKQNAQFGRYANLILTNGERGLDLSKLRFKFRTTSFELEAPNTLVARIYNLSDKTASKQNLQEYDTVILDAGYENNHAQIFKGTVKQRRRGKENNVDSFVEIMAADNDIGYNFGVVNKTM